MNKQPPDFIEVANTGGQKITKSAGYLRHELAQAGADALVGVVLIDVDTGKEMLFPVRRVKRLVSKTTGKQTLVIHVHEQQEPTSATGS